MKRNLKGYKVVRLMKGVLQSLRFQDITYPKDDWITPKEGDGPITLFKDDSQAWSFIINGISPDMQYGLNVFACQYVKSKHSEIWRTDDGLKYGPPSTMKYPEGTIFADKIKILYSQDGD